MNQYQITSQNRPVRVLYFVDESITYKQLVDLIDANLGLWGGRFNPIVPVKNGKVGTGYVEMLKHYDPDHVCYSKGVNEQVAKGIIGGNACEYERMEDDNWRRYAKGLNVYHLLGKYSRNHTLIVNEGLSRHDWPLAEFYKTNFGFGDTLLHYQEVLCDEISCHGVNDRNIHVLSQLLLQEGYLTNSDISSNGRSAPLFRPKNGWKPEVMEVVIAKDDTETADLLCYWNSALFDMGHSLFCTLEQFKTLIQDQRFFALLDKGRRNHRVDLASQTLTDQELSDLISKDLAAVNKNTMFQVRTRTAFPFEVDQEHTTWFRGSEPVQVHTMVSEEGIYYPPKLSFIDTVTDNFQHWAIDVTIDRAGEGSRQQLRFPRTANGRWLLPVQAVRVNLSRNLSAIIWSQTAWKETMTLRIPPFEHRLNQLLTLPFYQGAEHRSGFEKVRRSDDSNRLSGFFGLFHGHFATLEMFLGDKFWVDVFEECCKSERAAGDTITFSELLKQCKATMEREGFALDANAAPHHNTTNLTEGLKSTLEMLCGYRVFLKGYVLKCPNCASKFWYHLSEVGETFECKGCLSKNDIEVETPMAYKLNELIRKNMLHREVAPNGSISNRPDGNMTVIRTLLRLQARASESFEYSPQMNLHKSYNDVKPAGDLDIICLSKGRLFLGEAKHDSAAFKLEGRKSLNSLVEAVKALYPDQVVLSCTEDSTTSSQSNLNSAVEYVRDKIKDMAMPPTVEGIKLTAPDYGAFVSSMYFPN